MNKVVIFLADGTEECEALVTIDLLRRANIDITTVSINNTNKIKSSNGIIIETDSIVNNYDNFNEFDMIIIPGGMPGTDNISNIEIIRKSILEFNKKGKYLAAICAAPKLFGELGILQGAKAICYPYFVDKLNGATISDEDPCIYNNIITASGLGHVFPFALKLIEILKGVDERNQVCREIGYSL